MALERIGGYLNGYDAYNIPKATDDLKIGAPSQESLRKAQEETAKAAPQEENKEAEKPGLDLTVKEVPARENASIENIAISFGQYDISSMNLFEEKGLASEDMKQAISGMQRDKILHEYQYFVGGKDLEGKQRNIIAGTEDGLVIKL
ncbi:MAG: hypothetical protein II842_12795 [Butyrivibrio sp.]|nr:hypothetical protein [Butyrivibrio sp.]